MKTIFKIKYQKNIISIVIFLIGFIGFSQDKIQKEKLSFNSFSLTPLEVSFFGDLEVVSISADFSYEINKNVFTFSATTGEEITIWNRGVRVSQLNILYGREFELVNRLFLDAHAGIGLFFFNDSKDIKLTKMGIPLVVKFRYKTGNKFSIGMKFQANHNSVVNIYSVGLLLQWNFKLKNSKEF